VIACGRWRSVALLCCLCIGRNTAAKTDDATFSRVIGGTQSASLLPSGSSDCEAVATSLHCGNWVICYYLQGHLRSLRIMPKAYHFCQGANYGTSGGNHCSTKTWPELFCEVIYEDHPKSFWPSVIVVAVDACRCQWVCGKSVNYSAIYQLYEL